MKGRQEVEKLFVCVDIPFERHGGCGNVFSMNWAWSYGENFLLLLYA